MLGSYYIVINFWFTFIIVLYFNIKISLPLTNQDLQIVSENWEIKGKCTRLCWHKICLQLYNRFTTNAGMYTLPLSPNCLLLSVIFIQTLNICKLFAPNCVAGELAKFNAERLIKLHVLTPTIWHNFGLYHEH
mgnify:CR=1 FL=1